MENQYSKPNCFKPTKRKLVLPIIFLVLPFTLFLLPIPYLGIFFMFLILTLCIPFYPLLGMLGMTSDPTGWLDMYSGPSFGGVILVMVLYAIIFYLLGCFIAYIKNKRPQSEMNRDLRTTINQNPKIAVVIVIAILVLAGIIIALKL